MNFAESTQYLYSLGNEVSAMKLGLENIRKLLAALGSPQNNFLKVQVAGTNGKGSVCAFLDSICNTAGIKTGTFTSPHLVSITERIRINGSDISEEDFARHAHRVREMAEKMLASGELEYRPTFFEQITAIALVAFADANVALAILETGLGGRLDATTAVNAEIAAITRIDLDHQEYLGETIEEIAAEKAAIIGPWTKSVVLGEQEPNVLKILLDRCRKFEKFPDSAQKSFMPVVDVKKKTTKVYEVDNIPPDDLGVKLGLKGAHQVENAYTAVIVSGVISMDYDLQVSDDQVRSGLKNARHLGRLEHSGRYLFDGAHNTGGAKALARYLRHNEQTPVTMIFGVMRNKGVADMLSILAPLAESIIATEPSNLRSLSYEELLEHFPTDMSKEKVFVTDNVTNAVDIANEVALDEGIILVTGSLYLVGEVKKILKSQI
ncbi:MAG: bifunctional folylpolyglutamate synthase/dihydrofolate synthase [Chloracidobacterium sp.]|nr:bifunctional folylpolyglutamate synthase/dihydrofolate synthase [Chloracidobacterium sp.]